MLIVKEVSCCALQCIRQAANATRVCADEFEALLKRNHGKGNGYKGQYITATIVVLPDQNAAQYQNDIVYFKEKGWKELGIFPGAHPDLYNGPYKMHLWGSPTFEFPKESK